MAGFPGSAASRPPVAALVALGAVLVFAIGVIVAVVRGDDNRSTPAAGEVSTSTSGITTSPASPRLSMLVPPSSEAAVTGLLEVSGPACDAAVINSDLGFPNSRARILDCATGWAVLASGVSGAPYWVAYSDGRWRRAPDVSPSRGTCQDEAIARGAPEWMARRHLDACPPLAGQGRPTAAITSSPTRTSAAPEPPESPASSTRARTRTTTPTDPPTSSETTSSQTSVTPSTSETTSEAPTSGPPADTPAE